MTPCLLGFDPGSLRLYFDDIDESRVRGEQRLEPDE